MEKHAMHNAVLVLLSLLLIGCFSIHAECRAVLDGRGNDNHQVCFYSDCKGRYSKADCWCCKKVKDACYPVLDECDKTCPSLLEKM
ncbi:unnamed protein product [Urochloa decumbens]|uniref:Meg domain-containing protein n=1 Tax=Urochloa decumbens TaxID=240449 RepID=A0ABC9DNW4_9POAL